MTHSSQVIAATLLCLILTGLMWKIGPFSSNASFALEQVKDAFEQARTVRYTVTTTGWKGNPWPDPYITKVQMLEPGRSRFEENGEVQIMNAQQRQFTRILLEQKKVVIRPLYPTSSGIIASVDNFSRQLRSITKEVEQKTHRSDNRGSQVVEFLWQMSGEDYKVIADSVTKLPIRMEIDRGQHQGRNIREVISDFVFDAPIDESLFEVVVPNDFTVEKWVADETNDTYPAGDAETLIVSPGNFGPVKSGMATDQIIHILGKPDWVEKSEIPTSAVSDPRAMGKLRGVLERLMYDSRGFQITVFPGGELTFSCFNQLSSGPLCRDFVGQTKEGIELGAPKGEILETFGQPDIDRRDFLEYLGLGWQFSFREDKLCGIHSSRPKPKHRADGIQSRVLKDGTVIQAVPGVDIDALLDEKGNLKKKLWEKAIGSE